MIKLEELKNMATALTDIRRVDEKKMDKVDKDAVKGDFDDREDKDIDNDGDVDASDRYLHNRRKAVSKAVAKDTEESKDYGPGHIGAIQKMLDKERETKKSKGSVKKESTELEEKVYSSDYNVGHEKSQFGGYRPHVTHKKTGKTMYLGQTSYKKPEHAKGHAAAYLKGYEQMGDTTANRYANEYEKANKQHVYKESTELDEAKNAADHRQGLIDKIKKSGVVKSGSMSKKSVDEKAESEAQATAARIALKHKRAGTKPKPGSASAEMMKMSEKDLEDFTKMKKGAPKKVDEVSDKMLDEANIENKAKKSLYYGKKGADASNKNKSSRKKYGKLYPGSATAVSIGRKMSKGEAEVDEAKNAADHRQGLIDKIKKSGVVKSGSMSKKVNEAGRRRDYVPRGKKSRGDIEVDGQLVSYGQESWGQWTVTSPKRLTHIKANSKSDLIKMIKDELKESTVLDEDAWEEIPMMKRQLQFIKYAAEEIMGYMDMTMDPEEWFQNKLAHVHDQMQSLHAYIEGDKRMMAMEATDAEIRAKQTAGATEPEGIADKESEGSKNFMLRHTTEIPSEANIDEVIKANAEEIKASLQRKVSHRWNDQKTGDK